MLIGVATPSDLILDARRTPFNIGHRVDLSDFTDDEARPFSEGLGLPAAKAQRVMSWVLTWTGGHPYLTQRLCIELTRLGQTNWTAGDVAAAVEKTFLGDQSEQDNNLRFVRDMLTERAPNTLAVLRTYRAVYKSKPSVLDDERSLIKSHLKLSGVVKRAHHSLQVRNRIYGSVFDQQWIRQSWPENRWDRLKPAMPLIVGLVVVAAMMSGLAWYALDRAAFAEKALAGEAKQLKIAQEQRDLAIVHAKKAKDAGQDADNKRVEAETAKKSAEASKRAEAKQRQAAEQQTLIAQKERSRAEQQTLIAQKRQQDAEHARTQAEYQETVSKLQAQAASVLNWILTPTRAAKGLIVAISTIDQSERLAPQTMNTARSSLLSAVQTAREKNKLTGHTSSVSSVALSADGNTIVSGSLDNTVRLWDRAGNPIGEPFEGHTSEVSSVALSADGNTIVSGSLDNTVRLWDRAGNPIGEPFEGHTSSVYSVALSADGNTIVSGSLDNTVRLWDRAGNPIGEPFEGHTSSVSSVALSADGNTIVSGSWDNTVRLWPSSWQIWLALACHRLQFHPLLNTHDASATETLEQDFIEVANNARNVCEPLWNRSSRASSWP